MAVLAKSRTLPEQVTAYGKLKETPERYRNFRVLDFDERAALAFEKLLRLKIRVGTMDLRLAAITLAHDAVLLSRNKVDFAKVPGLKLEDWTVQTPAPPA